MDIKNIFTVLMVASLIILIVLSSVSAFYLSSAIKENSPEKKEKGQKVGKASKVFVYSTFVFLVIRVALIFM